MACINVELIDKYIHTDGNEYVYSGSRWTVRASILNNVPVTSDTTVYISYAGSTAPIGTAFSGTTRAVITSGKYYVDFYITVYDYDTCDNPYILVTTTTINSTCCSPINVNILCDTEGLRKAGKNCCGYYDKTHELWRDYYPTCMGNNKEPKFPDNMLKNGGYSLYDWYDSELYR